MGRTKAKATALSVPRSRDEAEAMLAKIGDAQREIALVQASLDQRVADAKADAESAVKLLTKRITELTDGLRVWAEANRPELTDNGKRQHGKLATGLIAWRRRPAKVTVRGVDAVLERIEALGLDRFVRLKREINKEAMLAEPKVAGGIEGVTIGSAGEDFVVEPVGLGLADGGR